MPESSASAPAPNPPASKVAWHFESAITFGVPGDAHHRVPEARLALELGEVVDPDVVFQGEPPDAGDGVEVLHELHAAGDVEVDDVRIHRQLRPLGPVASDRGPHAVGIDAEQAFRGVEAAEEGTVEPAVDDLSGSAAAVVIEGRHVDVDVDVERYPGEDRIDADVPTVVGLDCERLGVGGRGRRKNERDRRDEDVAPKRAVDESYV